MCNLCNGNKPPIGIKPRILHIESRISEIGRAIMLYSDAKIKIPVEWIEELDALASEHRILKGGNSCLNL